MKKIGKFFIFCLLFPLVIYGILILYVNIWVYKTFGNNFCWIEGSPESRGVQGQLLHEWYYFPNILKDIKIATSPIGEKNIYFGVVGLRNPMIFSVNGEDIKFDPEVHAWSYLNFEFWPPIKYYDARRKFQQTYGQAMEGISSLSLEEKNKRYKEQGEAADLFRENYPDDFGGEFLKPSLGVLEEECRKLIHIRKEK